MLIRQRDLFVPNVDAVCCLQSYSAVTAARGAERCCPVRAGDVAGDAFLLLHVAASLPAGLHGEVWLPTDSPRRPCRCPYSRPVLVEAIPSVVRVGRPVARTSGHRSGHKIGPARCWPPSSWRLCGDLAAHVDAGDKRSNEPDRAYVSRF
jgi:hypothetical protein